MWNADYEGPRTAKGIVEYVTGKMPTFVKRATTAKDVGELKAKVRRYLSTSFAWIQPAPVSTGAQEADRALVHVRGDGHAAVQGALD